MSGPAGVIMFGSTALDSALGSTGGGLTQSQAGSSLDEKSLGARTYNVRDFGAKGDGVAIDTVSVQSAIDACSKDKGGTVLIPAGDFVIGTIELKNNVTLHLVAQGKLLGSANPEHYKAGNGIPPSNGNIVMISAANAENITIEGPGTIDGNGAKFFTGKGDMTGPGQNSSQGYFQRPHLMHQPSHSRCLLNCQRLPLHTHSQLPSRVSKWSSNLQPR
jgi:polygalacturonase